MWWVLILAAGLWGLGILLRLTNWLRLAMIGVLWLAVLLAVLVLPVGNGLRRALGGEVRVWLVLGGVVVLGLGDWEVVRRLRRRAAPAEVPASGAFRAAELDRYARHILLREIGGPGQRKLKDSKVLVVGAGGLGSPALLYLAASGVGVIGVIDDDQVEASNLQRQIIHTDQRIGMAKVLSAAIAMRALNPFIEVRTDRRRLSEANAAAVLASYDLILDGSDNFDTRYMVNRVAVGLGKPLIAAAITQWEGQISLYDPAHGGPCFECVFPVRPAPGMVPSCAEAGVAAPLPGVIGAMMGLEAVKFLTGAGEGLRGRLLIYDGLFSECRVIGVKRREGCAVCGASA